MCPSASDLDKATALFANLWSTLFEEGRDRSEDRSAFLVVRTKKDLTKHRVTEEWAHQKCGWKHSAKDTEPLRSTTKGAATSALTECAFSWKFACGQIEVQP